MKFDARQATELVAAIDDRLKMLDKLFKQCIDKKQQAASEDVAASVRVCREAREKIINGD